MREKKLGLSMEAFGKLIDTNVQSGTVSNWETGKNLPNNSRLLKISRIAEISMEELLGELYSEEDVLKNTLLEYLKESDNYSMALIDLVDRYIHLWRTSIKLEEDIDIRGVSIYDEKAGMGKKNDSISLLVNVNKQMILILNKLGIESIPKVVDVIEEGL